MNAWLKIENAQVPDVPHNALLLFYAPEARYVWATSGNFGEVLKDYIDVTHYKVIAEAP